MVSFKTGEVWEVKRCTLSIEKAKKQLKKYTDHTLHDSYYKSLKLETGGSKGTVIESNHITRTAGETTYNITYWYQGDGIILYDYTTNINKEVVGVEVASAAIIAVGVVLTIITGGAAAPSIVLVFSIRRSKLICRLLIQENSIKSTDSTSAKSLSQWDSK